MMLIITENKIELGEREDPTVVDVECLDGNIIIDPMLFLRENNFMYDLYFEFILHLRKNLDLTRKQSKNFIPTNL